MALKLKEIKVIQGTIEIKTGLHIGSGDIEMHIGGTDNPVVKHPHTNEPYIPGSSLKGKIRSLLELKYGICGDEGQPSSSNLLNNISDPNTKKVLENIIKLFGNAIHENKENKFGPTRLSFYDCFLDEQTRKNILETGLSYYEIKSENVINRVTGTAEHPRHIERVISGLKFEFKLSLKIFDDDDENYFISLIKEGIDLLNKDSLGGYGSRGYGKVEIKINNN